jgi:hypothetical protein
MSNEIGTSQDCCSSSCNDTTVSQVPGPAGADGAPGEDGTDGHNAFTTLVLQFVQPAIAANVNIETADSAWMSVGQVIYITNGGYYQVVDDTFNFPQVKNLGYTGNAAPGSTVPTSSTISPGGLIGATGASGVSTLNAISPTTTKGDIIVDNGANNPNASDVRLGVGSNGKAVVADSTQPTGLIYATITPNSATDNAVPRYDGATGTPVPLQTSKVIVTDDGAVQASGSGGNARGTYSVDLQTIRSVATDVASADKATISGGDSNTASNNWATVSGGANNVASGLYSGIGGGQSNVASATNSSVVGGDTNTASGAESSVTGGANNVASGDWSSVPGGRVNVASGTYAVASGVGAQAINFAQQSFSADGLNGPGSCQRTELLWSINTTDATANVEMFLDGVSARAVVPVGRSWAFDIILVARDPFGVGAAWHITGAIQNTATVTALLSAVAKAMYADSTGSTWGAVGHVTVSADDTHDCLHIDVTGAIATSIHWTAHARIIEVAS